MEIRKYGGERNEEIYNSGEGEIRKNRNNDRREGRRKIQENRKEMKRKVG
jgi:hypothetical protein